MGVDLKKLASDLYDAYEELDGVVCDQISNDALRSLALKVGVDHTVEPDLILERIGERFDELRSAVVELSPARTNSQVFVDGKLFDIDMPRKAPNSWTYDPNLGWITPVIVTSKERPW